MEFAHISDLHVGKTPAAALRSLARSLRALPLAVITGDVTEGGRLSEARLFALIFRGIRAAIVPGNHDRLGDGVGANWAPARVQISTGGGLYLIQVDTTAPHNRWLGFGHGSLCHQVLDAVDLALEAAPPDHVVAIALHHHPLPLPEEGVWERLSRALRLPFAQELHLGHRLINLAQGRCDLILHGHRHKAAETLIDGPRPLWIYNAGASATLGRYRVFTLEDGQIVRVEWKDV